VALINELKDIESADQVSEVDTVVENLFVKADNCQMNGDIEIY
jgi:hypothetical protein